MKNKMFINMLPIETNRLILNKTTKEDIDLILKMDKQISTQYYLGGIKNKTREERLLFLKEKEKKYKEGYLESLTVTLKEGISIGFIGLKINEKDNTVELSYIFDSDYCNRGFCTEACSKIIEIFFKILKINRISANVINQNEKSINVLKKLGFRRNEEKNQFLNYTFQKEEYIDNKRSSYE